MTLQQLNQIITIADAGSMNEAARQLFISQPNLSSAVKEVENEIGITIFLRTNRGIQVTPEGAEFIGYARQTVEQYRLLESRYIRKTAKKIFSVSAQHYSFAVEAFIATVQRFGMDQYEFSIHETRTHTVIDDVKNMKSEIGILYLSDFNEQVLTKLFRENSLVFTELFSCDTYVYLAKSHPLADRQILTMEELKDYPCLSFDQGSHGSFYFAEEMNATYDYPKLIRADDRATMLNLMVGLNAYTLCSGIISENLNGDGYTAIPLKESKPMRIGYLKHRSVKLSEIGEAYIAEISKYKDQVLRSE